MLNEFEFTRRHQFSQIKSELKQVVAEFFTQNNKQEAQHLLEGTQNQMSRNDICIIAFFFGAIITMIISLIFFIMDKQDDIEVIQ